jgi:hypothetical protein
MTDAMTVDGTTI